MSNTLTASQLHFVVKVCSVQQGRGHVSSPAFSIAVSYTIRVCHRFVAPKAAALSVPKARYFSSWGSHTSISPSSIKLNQSATIAALELHILPDIILESVRDILRQAPLSDVRSVQICYISDR